MSAIVTENLTKIYGNGTKALDNVSVNIKDKGITCILGKNGAGKTTFLRIIGTQLFPTSGKFTVLGYDGIKEADKIREKIAVVPQEARTFNLYTPWDHVYYYALLRGMSRITAKQETKRVLEELGLYDIRNKMCFELSGGLRQRVLIAMALVSNAEIMLLDEPTIGLDPLARREVWSYIKKLPLMGHTILLTTHYLDEAELLADDIIIINNGKIILHGTPEELKKSITSKFTIILEGYNNKELKIEKLEINKIEYGSKIMIHANDEEELLEIIKYAIKNKLKIQVYPTTLEDVFLKSVGGLD